MGQYLRASRKQLDFIANLCAQLGETNPTLYRKYKLEEATKLINRLKRKLDKKNAQDRQIRLL